MFINGEYVDDELIRLEAQSLRAEVEGQMPDSDELEVGMRAREYARENVIERILVQQTAKRDPTPIPNQAIEKALEQYYSREVREAACMLPRDRETLRRTIELDLRVERLLQKITATIPRPKSGEIVAYYEESKLSFCTPEMVHAAHIIKNIEETANESEALATITEIEALLKNGASFEELADQYSDCPGRGGDLGFFPRGEMVEEFESVVFSLAPGETSKIFRSPFGYHIAKLYERKPAGVRSLNDVRGEIERLIWEQKKQQAVRSFIRDLRLQAEIRRSSPANSHRAT